MWVLILIIIVILCTDLILLKILLNRLKYYQEQKKKLMEYEKETRDFEKFKKRVVRKLSLLNPEKNKKLFEEYLELDSLTINHLKISNDENFSKEKRLESSRIALHYMIMKGHALAALEKKMSRISKIKEP